MWCVDIGKQTSISGNWFYIIVIYLVILINNLLMNDLFNAYDIKSMLMRYYLTIYMSYPSAIYFVMFIIGTATTIRIRRHG